MLLSGLRSSANRNSQAFFEKLIVYTILNPLLYIPFTLKDNAVLKMIYVILNALVNRRYHVTQEEFQAEIIMTVKCLVRQHQRK